MQIPLAHVWPGHGPPLMRKTESASRPARWRLAVALLAILAASATATIGAMRHTSTTFDEVITIAAGARGFMTGRFDVVDDHPPLMQYLYGLPVYLTHPSFPPEAAGGRRPNRYTYAADLFGRRGNDPEYLAVLPRMIAAICAALLGLAVFLESHRAFGARAALFAVILCAFLPDVLAHGGVAYSDLPLALCWFCTLFAMDAVVREPSAARAARAGAWIAISMGVKFSAVAIAPAAALLLGAEALVRPGDRRWRERVLRATAIGGLSAYLLLVAIYRGDFSLAEMVRGLGLMLHHVTTGHDAAPAYLLGHTSPRGWWYFFPVAFVFKTPAALHLLMLTALFGIARRSTQPGGTTGWRQRVQSPLRAPVVGSVVFGGSLLASGLDIGFRYALPLLPLLCVLVGVGLGRLWQGLRLRGRAGVVALCTWYVVSSLSYYPHFLAYLSEYWPWPDAGYRVLVDSSLDWGQGLLEVRNFMRKNGIPRVYLSYFGSALPEGYGIDYVALPSFFKLPPHGVQPGESPPELAIISATNLAGVYLEGDPFARLRDEPPLAVLGHTMYVYPARPERPTRSPGPTGESVSKIP